MGQFDKAEKMITDNRVLFHRVANTLNYLDIKTVVVSCGTCYDQLQGYEFDKIFPGCRIIDIHEYLLEKGITFVQLSHSNYDTHNENFNFHIEQLGEFIAPTFQALAAAPPQSIPDPKRNGYFLLLGLGESPSVDPMKAGYERWQRVELQRPRCTDPVEETDRPLLTAADPVALSAWFRGGIPTTQFRVRRASLEGWTRSNHLLTSRYEQWFTMPFEDSGFGTLTGPDCAQVLAVHRHSRHVPVHVPRGELLPAVYHRVSPRARARSSSHSWKKGGSTATLPASSRTST